MFLLSVRTPHSHNDNENGTDFAPFFVVDVRWWHAIYVDRFTLLFELEFNI